MTPTVDTVIDSLCSPHPDPWG